MAITVTGRPKRQWLVETYPMNGFLRLRLDDVRDPEHWQTIDIPHHDLLVLLAKVHQLTYAPEIDRELPEADDIAKLFGLKRVEPGG